MLQILPICAGLAHGPSTLLPDSDAASSLGDESVSWVAVPVSGKFQVESTARAVLRDLRLLIDAGPNLKQLRPALAGVKVLRDLRLLRCLRDPGVSAKDRDARRLRTVSGRKSHQYKWPALLLHRRAVLRQARAWRVSQCGSESLLHWQCRSPCSKRRLKGQPGSSKSTVV